MSNYENSGNRYTAIFVRRRQENGGTLYERAPFDLVRFNVDMNPDGKPELVPVGSDSGKLFEKIWRVDELPFGQKQRWMG